MLQLTSKEIDNRDKVLKEAGYNILDDIEGSAEGSRSYHYEVHPTGIGDCIYLIYKGERHDITDWECW